jgi:hypothetical protein
VNPDLVIDTEKMTTEAGVNALVRYVEHHLVSPVKNMAIEGDSDYAGTGI